MTDDILQFTGEHNWLHPCYTLGFTKLGGVEYRTIQHAYQAFKFLPGETRRRIRSLVCPYDALRLGRETHATNEAWTINREDRIAVVEAMLVTRYCSAMLQSQLLATGDACLVFGDSGERFWGVTDGEGRNELGKATMRVRAYYGGYGETFLWSDL